MARQRQLKQQELVAVDELSQSAKDLKRESQRAEGLKSYFGLLTGRLEEAAALAKLHVEEQEHMDELKTFVELGRQARTSGARWGAELSKLMLDDLERREAELISLQEHAMCRNRIVRKIQRIARQRYLKRSGSSCQSDPISASRPSWSTPAAGGSDAMEADGSSGASSLPSPLRTRVVAAIRAATAFRAARVQPAAEGETPPSDGSHAPSSAQLPSDDTSDDARPQARAVSADAMNADASADGHGAVPSQAAREHGKKGGYLTKFGR